ncbi:MAG TPA: aquaporin, partial [Verrucomicrobiae bacterium]|nr:aquaporin [Verrucomicrobiae bacterium]
MAYRAAVPVERSTISRRLAAEAVGTAFLLAAVVGSGIMGERLSRGNMGLALLANTMATGAALVALILAFGSISGAHFNPAVTAMDAAHGGILSSDVPGYVVAQVVGAVVGVAVANLMFGEPVIALSRHARHGGAQLLSEAVATFGLLTTIAGAARHPQPAVVALAVGAYIAAAYWFTA